MAWGDPTSLKFNIEEISKMRNKIKDTAFDLANFKTQLLHEVQILKTNWQTPAGKKYTSKIDTDWSIQVDQYIKYIKAVDELLEVAEDNYRTVEDEAQKISF